MNLLNEKLSAIRRQKAVTKKEMEEETSKNRKFTLANKIRLLNEEEKETLAQLGVKIK